MSTNVFLAINGPVENMNKELCGLVRCFRIYLREKAKMEITTESPLLPWLVRHCGWILSRYAVRADGRTGYSRLKGREYTSGIAVLGEALHIAWQPFAASTHEFPPTGGRGNVLSVHLQSDLCIVGIRVTYVTSLVRMSRLATNCTRVSPNESFMI